MKIYKQQIRSYTEANNDNSNIPTININNKDVILSMKV